MRRRLPRDVGTKILIGLRRSLLGELRMAMTATARTHSFGGDSCGVVCRVMSEQKNLSDCVVVCLKNEG